uniref:Uncharacterized protein n=2 Tax=Viruses TaxID=10239 RepID=A0A8S5RHV3_9VIRU|nr:MAG TPA: hypothetical protein [virus sp. ctML55]DAF44717.1 MAG TPA: hypothetical protein [Podoviridae sp. ct8Lf7]
MLRSITLLLIRSRQKYRHFINKRESIFPP